MRAIFIASQLLICASNMLSAQLEPINPQEPYTVCHVLQNLDLYQGKIIQIRGEWDGGDIRDKCRTQIKTGDYKWPNSIELIYTENLHKYDEPANWTFGSSDFYPFFNEALRYKPPVYATIVGRLDARLEVAPDPEGGPPSPRGYGHLGAYPARMVMMAIKDIVGSGLRKGNPTK